MSTQTGTTVPLFPFYLRAPVFEGGSRTQPIPFLSSCSSQGSPHEHQHHRHAGWEQCCWSGLKTLSEGRNEFRPPVLSKINQPAIQERRHRTETRHIMIMVTPRIIINGEDLPDRGTTAAAAAVGTSGRSEIETHPVRQMGFFLDRMDPGRRSGSRCRRVQSGLLDTMADPHQSRRWQGL